MGQGKQGKEAAKASKEEVTSPEATVALDEETEALVSGLADNKLVERASIKIIHPLNVGRSFRHTCSSQGGSSPPSHRIADPVNIHVDQLNALGRLKKLGGRYIINTTDKGIGLLENERIIQSLV